MPLNPGQTVINRYRITRLLGQGGFGAVYRAWDLNLEASCAIKENLDTSPEIQEQFRREAVILANLSHPNLPRVRDHFFISGQGQYLVMDFVEGEDLRQKLDRLGHPLSEHQVLPWIEQVCDALQYLHSQNPPIIHRDIKPDNIKITPGGQAMLVDFGIAKIFHPQMGTGQGARAITPGYSPVEQYGKSGTDARSDIYSLGATLYTLMTNLEPPESIMRNLGENLIPPCRLNPAVTARMDGVIQKAMQVLPEDRYLSIGGMVTALYHQPTVQVTTPVPPVSQYESAVGGSRQVSHPPKKRSLKWLWIIVALVFLLGSICMCVGLWWLWENGDAIFGL